MRIEQLMSREVATCLPEHSLADATRAMWDHDCGSIPVVETPESQRLVGVLTDRDACMSALLSGRTLDTQPVAAAMSRELMTCKPDDTPGHALALLREARVHRLPVVDATGKLVGMLTLGDLARAVTTGLTDELDAKDVAAAFAHVYTPRKMMAREEEAATSPKARKTTKRS